MKNLSKSIALTFLAIGTASTVNAQVLYEPIYSPDFMMQQNNIQFNPVVNRVIEDGRNSNSTKASENSQNAEIDISAATYTPSKARTKANLAAFADKTRAVDPAQAEQLEQLFASTDIMGQISEIMSSVGLSKNNVADAYALYWVNAWQVAHGDSSTPSAKTMKAVATQAARGLSQSPEFANANEAQKQEMAEALLIQGVMIASAFEQLAGNKTQLEAVSKAVKQGASASGLELDTMTLTEEGFREGGPRKRSDASDAAESEKALAANDTGTDGDGSTNYALIAAAAGAGLGGVFLLGKAMGRKG